MAGRIVAKAELSVARGCGFGALAIGTFMVGSITDPSAAFKSGGVLTLLACFILILKANLALQKPYKRTELWLLLEQGERPQPAVAQQVIGSIMRDVFLRFALHCAHLALAMLVASLVFRMLPAAN